jgi:hypothetical protein
MHLKFAPETETFRAQVRSWFETEFPKDIIAKYKAGTALATADVRRSEMARVYGDRHRIAGPATADTGTGIE